MRIAFAFIMFAAGTDPVVLTENHDGKRIAIATDDTVLLKLPVASGTGYGWQVAGKLKHLELVGKPVRTKAEKPGATVTETFRFRVTGTGECDLKLEYRRPADKAAEKTFDVHLAIKE